MHDAPARPADKGLRHRTSATLVCFVIGLLGANQAADAATVPPKFFGVSAIAPNANDFDRMAAGGVGTYRFGIGWRGVQPTIDSPYRWGGPDQIFRQLAINGIQPLPMLFGTPRFVSHNAGKSIPPVRSSTARREWEQFVAAALQRYGPGGDFWLQSPALVPAVPADWIIWNEQNARTFWHPKASPKEYALLLKISDRAISSVDPLARIVIGGMYGYPHDERSMYAAEFLRRLYRQPGAASHFDAVALHPYGRDLKEVKRQIQRARSVMRRAGDGAARIVIGEIGWASSGPRGNQFVVGKKGQAKRIHAAMTMFARKRRRWGLAGANIFVFRDYGADAVCPWCPHAGLLTRGSKPKPAWRAYRQVVRATG